MKPSISVIIPTFNRDKLLKRCLSSVLAAVAEHDELIVVNSGDSDDTQDVTRSFGDPRIRYVKQDDAGISASRNYGMELARNDLVAFIDDDDEWHPQKLNIQRQLLARHPDAVGCFTNIWATDSGGNVKPNYLFEWGQPVRNWNLLLGETRSFRPDNFEENINYYLGDHYFNQMLDDYVLPSSLLIDRAKFRDDLTFRVGMQRNESWLFTSQVCRQGPVIYVDIDLACHHGDASNRLTAIPQVDTIMSRLYVLQNEFGTCADFLAEHKEEFDRRVAREAKNLFRSVMARGVSDRSKVLAEHANLDWKIAVTAKIPDIALPFVSLCFRVVNFGRRQVLRLLPQLNE